MSELLGVLSGGGDEGSKLAKRSLPKRESSCLRIDVGEVMLGPGGGGGSCFVSSVGDLSFEVSVLEGWEWSGEPWEDAREPGGELPAVAGGLGDDLVADDADGGKATN